MKRRKQTKVSAAASAMARKRWSKATAAERAAYGQRLVEARRAIRAARETAAAQEADTETTKIPA